MVVVWHTSAVIALAATACTADPSALEWGFRFARPELRDRAVKIDAAILRGGCTGDPVYEAVLRLPSGMAPMPSTLGPGTYGFTGRASDDECTWFASGCTAIELPADSQAQVVVVLDDDGITPTPECAMDMCTAGLCEGRLDAGGSDAGGSDAGRRDAGDMPGMDAGRRDAGTRLDAGDIDAAACGRESCNTRDDDCDLAVDEDWDLASDPSNCGACGRPCGDAEYCSSSTCTCRPGLTDVGGSCVDLDTDPMNCGMPGRACTMGTMVVCREGACEDSCTAGQTNCMNACVDVTTDPLNCGVCGNTCSHDELCMDRRCEEYVPAIGCSSCPCDTVCRGDFDICLPYGTGLFCVRNEM